MSEDDVDLVRRLFEAFNRSPVDLRPLVEEFFDPGIVWEGAEGAPDAGPFHGRDAVLGHLRSWRETLDEFRSEPEEFIDAGDRVVVVQYSHGRVKGSGVEVAQRFATVYAVRDRTIVSLRQFRDRAEALQASGRVAG